MDDKARKAGAGLPLRPRGWNLVLVRVSSGALPWLCGEGLRGWVTRVEPEASGTESQGSRLPQHLVPAKTGTAENSAAP